MRSMRGSLAAAAFEPSHQLRCPEKATPSAEREATKARTKEWWKLCEPVEENCLFALWRYRPDRVSLGKFGIGRGKRG